MKKVFRIFVCFLVSLFVVACQRDGGSEKVNKQNHLSETSIVSYQQLPSDIKFELTDEVFPFDHVNLSLRLPSRKYSFGREDIQLKKISYNQRNIVGTKLKLFKSSQYQQKSHQIKSWHLKPGQEGILPKGEGDYEITFFFKALDQHWKVKSNLKMTFPEEGRDGYVDFGKERLSEFLYHDFHQKNLEEKHYAKLLAFLKKYPSHQLSQKVKRNFENSLKGAIYFSDDLEKYIPICNILNEVGNVGAIRIIYGLKKKSHAKTDKIRLRTERIAALERLLKPKIVPAENDTQLKTPKTVTPYKFGQLQLIIGKELFHKYRECEIYKLEINGAKQELPFFSKWNVKGIQKGAKYEMTSSLMLLPNKPGNYSLKLTILSTDKIIEFDEVFFAVKTPSTEKQAFDVAKTTDIEKIFNYSSSKPLEGINLSKVGQFLQAFPDSDIANEAKKALQEIAIKHINGQVDISENKLKDCALIIKSFDSTKVLELAVQISRNSSQEKLKTAALFWEKNLNQVYKAPVGISLVNTQSTYLPFEFKKIKLEWNDIKRFSALPKKIVGLKINGQKVEMPIENFWANRKKYHQTDFYTPLFEKPGEYKLIAHFSLGGQVFSSPEMVVKVVVPEKEKLAFSKLPLKDFKELVNNPITPSYSFRSRALLEYVKTFPNSAFTQMINKALEAYPARDCRYVAKGIYEEKNISDKERLLVAEILNLTNSFEARRQVDRLKNSFNLRLKKQWLDILKPKLAPAPRSASVRMPEVIEAFKPFNISVKVPKGTKGKITLSKVEINHCKIEFNEWSKTRSFDWANTLNMPFEEGEYSAKIYGMGPDGLFLAGETSFRLKSNTNNKKAYQDFVEMGIANAICGQYKTAFPILLKDASLTKNLKDFVCKYPNDPCVKLISNRLIATLDSNWLSRCNDLMIRDYVEIAKLCGDWERINKKMPTAYSKSGKYKKAALDKIKEAMLKYN